MMKRTSRRLRLCITLLVLNLLFIWGNSCLPGSVSGAISGWLSELLGGLLPGMVPDAEDGEHLLRKMAHFTEYCCLGVSLCWLFGMLRHKTAEYTALPLLCGFLAACADETIQRFSPGRSPSPVDVGIDTAGVALGIGLLFFGHLIYRKTKEHNLEETL